LNTFSVLAPAMRRHENMTSTALQVYEICGVFNPFSCKHVHCLACCFNDLIASPFRLQAIMSLLSSKAWSIRYAACVALGAFGEDAARAVSMV
jgi:hypothetical protein